MAALIMLGCGVEIIETRDALAAQGKNCSSSEDHLDALIHIHRY
jgi:hypothetical protein